MTESTNIRLGEIKKEIGGYTFTYPIPRNWQTSHEVVKAWNKKTEEHRKIIIQKLPLVQKAICKLGIHNRKKDTHIYACVLEDIATYCSKCGKCFNVDHHWHSD